MGFRFDSPRSTLAGLGFALLALAIALLDYLAVVELTVGFDGTTTPLEYGIAAAVAVTFGLLWLTMDDAF